MSVKIKRPKPLTINLPWRFVSGDPDAEMIVNPTEGQLARHVLFSFVEGMTDQQCLLVEEFLRESDEIEITTPTSRMYAKRQEQYRENDNA